ncbi:hypothetical protein BDZ97DRAFT_1752471 [Flammula alnicola]|nr:hypothetical protein BDZ97DRAFT_1752471 [Flammula alnicola]
MNQTRKVTYRTGLFDPTNLTTLGKINDALNEFASVLSRANHVQALEDVFDNSHIVELILSGLSDEIPLSEWILEQFPTSPKSFESSFSSKLISKLSHFFLFHLSSDETVRNHHQTANLAPEILQALFAGIFLEEDRLQVNAERPASSKKIFAKSSQKQAKLAKKATRNNALDERPFAALNIPIPRTRRDAEAAAVSLLQRLKIILEFYLSRIRVPETSNSIKESFIPQDRPDDLKILTESISPTDDSPPPPAPTTVTDTNSAFPMVLPMKSALYFDSPEGFGEWRILRLPSKGGKVFGIIVKKIKALSNGHFSDDNQKRLNGPTTDIPIFEAKMTRDLRLIYQVDCVVDYDNNSESQVLRIFGIYTHAQMDGRMWEGVASNLSKRGKLYKARCLERICLSRGGNVYAPATYGDLASSDPVLNNEESSTQPCQMCLRMTVISSSKFLVAQNPHELLESIEADRDAAFPFEVSPQEKAIIQHPSSCYVLGRSGTGKTTTMLFKMLLIERAYQMSSESTRPRQIFVTKSRVLAKKVEEHFVMYLASLASASHITKEMRSPRLERVDDDDENLRNEEDNDKWRNDLPPRFSQLEDRHFPLFVTFDRLCAMVEADIEQVRQDTCFESGFNPSEFQPMPTSAKAGKFITFDRFMGEYWPHFTQSLKKKFRVIQGSAGTVMSANGFLDRETYETLSGRTQPTFAEHRSDLYDIFLSYRAVKKKLCDFDASDRTHSILRTFSTRSMIGQRIDYLYLIFHSLSTVRYVDETQDNLLIDTLHGLFWAGDTAQTISAGSSFRFNDLKSFLFRIEKQSQLSNSSSTIPVNPKLQPPKAFHLAVNYRSHAGIVNCAQSVIDLILKYWRYTIDALPREFSNTDGAKPIFYTDIYPGFIHEGDFLSRNRKSNEKIELGANQCILVRDEAARQQLVEEIGDIGLIMTLYDSKGLEFNDVFLYNFFHDSAVSSYQWRVVLNGIGDEVSDSSKRAPEFDVARHAAICSELKCLYVAITRARNNLRIADESMKGEPMRALWESRDQIRSCKPGDHLADFAAPSTKEEWAKRGRELFANEKYALARDSYKRAQKPNAAAVANAYYLREVATRTSALSTKSKAGNREVAFKIAGEAFSSCARNTNDLETQQSYYGLSADCLVHAGEIHQAADTYRLAGNFTEASLLFRKLGKFDDVHNIITTSGNKINPGVLETVQDVLRLYYVNRKDFKKAHQLFETVDEEIEYLEDRNLDMAQLDLLLLHGRRMEAAELHLAEGRVLEAIDLFMQTTQTTGILYSKAKNCIFQGLWQLLAFGALNSPPRLDEVNELLDRSYLLDEGMLNQNDQDEIKMFQFIALENLTSSYALQILSCEPRVWKLFGIKPNKQEDAFIAPFGTFIHRNTPGNIGTKDETGSGLVLPKDELAKIFQGSLRDRLLDRVTRENDMCRRASALYLCLRHITYGDCDASPCNRSHIFPDSAWFQDWVKVHLLQILIYHSICSIQFNAEMQAQRRQGFRCRDRLDSGAILFSGILAVISFPDNCDANCDLAFTLTRRKLRSKRTRAKLAPGIADCSRWESPSSLLMGILFIRHVMEASIPIDINVFCGFIEHHLLYGAEFRTIATLGTTIRSLYIARICRILGLLGYNITVDNFQLDIYTILTSLRKVPNHGFSPLYGRYIFAESFADIMIVTRRSMQGSPLDEMVQLKHSERFYASFGIHFSIDLKFSDYYSPLTSMKSIGDVDNIRMEEQGPRKRMKMILSLWIVLAMLLNKTQTSSLKPRYLRRLRRSFRQGGRSRDCYTKIYRTLQEKKRVFDKPGLYPSTYRWFLEYWKTRQPAMARDAIESLVLAKKSELRRRLVREDIRHEDLDEVGPTLSHMNIVIKGIKNCRLVLGPGADVHQRRDLEELKKHVKNALGLLGSLQLRLDIPEDIISGLGIVHKGILREKRVPMTAKKEKRPSLGLEDPLDPMQHSDSWDDDST